MKRLKIKNACTAVTGLTFLVLKCGSFEIAFLALTQYFPAE
jgi:hypothetical protein